MTTPFEIAIVNTFVIFRILHDRHPDKVRSPAIGTFSFGSCEFECTVG